jgi:hypothetical protein
MCICHPPFPVNVILTYPTGRTGWGSKAAKVTYRVLHSVRIPIEFRSVAGRPEVPRLSPSLQKTARKVS